LANRGHEHALRRHRSTRDRPLMEMTSTSENGSSGAVRQFNA
jgi:hypothetical protein